MLDDTNPLRRLKDLDCESPGVDREALLSVLCKPETQVRPLPETGDVRSSSKAKRWLAVAGIFSAVAASAVLAFLYGPSGLLDQTGRELDVSLKAVNALRSESDGLQAELEELLSMEDFRLEEVYWDLEHVPSPARLQSELRASEALLLLASETRDETLANGIASSLAANYSDSPAAPNLPMFGRSP